MIRLVVKLPNYPTTKLDYESVKKKLDENRKIVLLGSPQDQEKMIRETLTNLEQLSMINRPLLNPVQSKREYIWLFLIVGLENIIALYIELYNGGVWASEGHYYSCETRISILVLAIL